MALFPQASPYIPWRRTVKFYVRKSPLPGLHTVLIHTYRHPSRALALAAAISFLTGLYACYCGAGRGVNTVPPAVMMAAGSDRLASGRFIDSLSEIYKKGAAGEMLNVLRD